MKSSFRIAEIAFGNSRWDGTYEFALGSDRFEVQRFGAEFSVETIKEIIKRLRSQVDAFAITALPTELRFQDRTYVHRQALEVMTIPSSVPICNGERLRELANINGLSMAIASGAIQPKDGIYFPLALLNLESTNFLSEKYSDHLAFGDIYAVMGLPILTHMKSPQHLLTTLGLNLANLRDIRGLSPHRDSWIGDLTKDRFLSRVQKMRYIFADPGLLLLFGSDISFAKGKDLIIPYSHPEMEKLLLVAQPNSILNLFPKPFAELTGYQSHSVMDAALRLSRRVDAPLSLEDWQRLLSTETEVTQSTKRYVLGSRPSVQVKLTKRIRGLKNSPRRREPDFAFVIHCLAYDYLYHAPLIGGLLERAPDSWAPTIERNLARLPGIVYGRASGIVSKKTGQELTGIIYGLFATPKVMREEPPEVTYAKIERLCHHAANAGAKIIGLGAYTKIVGDAGATINRNSPIPVTTGNSLSASATLWALYEAVKKMDLLKMDPATGRVDATATVIGATGSIGKVSSKLLAMVCRRLCIVAPKQERLNELKAELEKLSPDCQILCSTDANDFAAQTDVLVTATSSFDQKIIDIERLKPGCVVCDCSRPLDFSMEDTIKRPDILIIESGEVVLPGHGRQFSCDLGLPGNVVYACLGETAILAMEGRHEPFTLGREIHWPKVKEIYKLARAHGVELAAIRGHNGIITDKEIALTRQIALQRRKV
jgi:predicted amino acid dehydrogenase